MAATYARASTSGGVSFARGGALASRRRGALRPSSSRGDGARASEKMVGRGQLLTQLLQHHPRRGGGRGRACVTPVRSASGRSDPGWAPPPGRLDEGAARDRVMQLCSTAQVTRSLCSLANHPTASTHPRLVFPLLGTFFGFFKFYIFDDHNTCCGFNATS